MPHPIHILFLVDDPSAVELVKNTLNKKKLPSLIERAHDEKSFVAAVEDKYFDVILADFDLSALEGNRALEIVKRRMPDLPFIFVAEPMREDVVIDNLKNGATDYVLENNLSRLAPAIRRALRETEERLRCRRSEARLRRFVEELVRSNGDLQQFAYVASHDLQEPLRRIANFTELLAKKYQGYFDQTADKYIDYIIDGAKRMQKLIHDLLMYSQISRTGFSVEETDLNKIVEDILKDYEDEINRTNAVVTLDPLPTLLVSPIYMRQLLQNLISNALKFRRTAPHKVHISATSRAGQVQLSVKDNGIGMESKFSERVFAIFHRLHSSDEYPGTGIGLAICKRIVEKHGGSIWFSSKSNEGTTFYFTIPSAQK